MACPGSILESPLTAANADTRGTAGTITSSLGATGRPVASAVGSYSVVGQPGKAAQLFGALPAIGSPRGVYASQAAGCSSSNASSCGGGAAYLKRTAKVFAQEQEEPGPGIILAPWKEQQHVEAVTGVAAARWSSGQLRLSQQLGASGSGVLE
jgi:hypothetical protein